MATPSEILMAVLQRAASDPAYRETLKARPQQVLVEAGLRVPEDVSYEMVTALPGRLDVAAPQPDEEELGGEVLEPRATKSGLLCVPGPFNIITLADVCIIA